MSHCSWVTFSGLLVKNWVNRSLNLVRLLTESLKTLHVQSVTGQVLVAIPECSENQNSAKCWSGTG